MIEERLKITNLEDRLKTEMGGGVMPGDINATADALRMALQQEERLKLELGNLKNMENLLGGAGMARMLQMMETDAKNFSNMQTSSGMESGPGSSSGSVPHSPKHSGSGGGHESGSPETREVCYVLNKTKKFGSMVTYVLISNFIFYVKINFTLFQKLLSYLIQ